MKIKKVLVRILSVALMLVMFAVGFTLPSSAAVIDDNIVSPNIITISDGRVHITEGMVGSNGGQAYADVYFWHTGKGTDNALFRLHAEVKGGPIETHYTTVSMLISNSPGNDSDDLFMTTHSEGTRILTGEVTLGVDKILPGLSGNGYCDIDSDEVGGSGYWGAIYVYDFNPVTYTWTERTI